MNNSSSFIFDSIILILAGNEDMHESLNEFKFRPDTTTISRVIGITIYRNGPKRTFVDTETDSLSTETDSLGTETDRNGPKRTFMNTETDSIEYRIFACLKN